MKWITICDYHYNADHIAEFQWNMGKLYVWDDIPITENVVENVNIFDDSNGEIYRSLCKQLEVNVAAIGLPDSPRCIDKTKYPYFDCSNWQAWVCSDGSRFSTFARAEEHEGGINEAD